MHEFLPRVLGDGFLARTWILIMTENTSYLRMTSVMLDHFLSTFCPLDWVFLLETSTFLNSVNSLITFIPLLMGSESFLCIVYDLDDTARVCPSPVKVVVRTEIGTSSLGPPVQNRVGLIPSLLKVLTWWRKLNCTSLFDGHSHPVELHFCILKKCDFILI